jgi:hypothetical protein
MDNPQSRDQVAIWALAWRSVCYFPWMLAKFLILLALGLAYLLLPLHLVLTLLTADWTRSVLTLIVWLAIRFVWNQFECWKQWDLSEARHP